MAPPRTKSPPPVTEEQTNALGTRVRKVSGVHTLTCTECGKVMVDKQANRRTCSPACRVARTRRRKKGDMRERLPHASDAQVALAEASRKGLDKLPQIAREVLADEIRPVVREELMKADVLDSIGDMVKLLPLAQDAIRDDLTARVPVYDDAYQPVLDENGEHMHRVDYDRRSRAVAIVLKYTVGQPALAPQPEQPEHQGLIINFPGLPQPASIDGEIVEEAEQLAIEEGSSRQCDVCAEVKPASEFVGDSPRCTLCHAAVRERARIMLEEKESKQLK